MILWCTCTPLLPLVHVAPCCQCRTGSSLASSFRRAAMVTSRRTDCACHCTEMPPRNMDYGGLGRSARRGARFWTGRGYPTEVSGGPPPGSARASAPASARSLLWRRSTAQAAQALALCPPQSPACACPADALAPQLARLPRPARSGATSSALLSCAEASAAPRSRHLCRISVKHSDPWAMTGRGGISTSTWRERAVVHRRHVQPLPPPPVAHPAAGMLYKLPCFRPPSGPPLARPRRAWSCYHPTSFRTTTFWFRSLHPLA